METKILVKNLNFGMREKHVHKQFGKYGKISSIVIPPKEGENPQNLNQGYAYIEFENGESAEKAISKMNDK